MSRVVHLSPGNAAMRETLVSGVSVQHILSDGKLESHKLSELAQVEDRNVTYPERHPLFD